MDDNNELVRGTRPGEPSPIDEYDRLVRAIEEIVERLETGDLPLAEALLEYQRGIELVKLCNDLLDQAELRISELATGLGLEREADQPFRDDYRRYFSAPADDNDGTDGNGFFTS